MKPVLGAVLFGILSLIIVLNDEPALLKELRATNVTV